MDPSGCLGKRSTAPTTMCMCHVASWQCPSIPGQAAAGAKGRLARSARLSWHVFGVSPTWMPASMESGSDCMMATIASCAGVHKPGLATSDLFYKRSLASTTSPRSLASSSLSHHDGANFVNLEQTVSGTTRITSRCLPIPGLGSAALLGSSRHRYRVQATAVGRLLVGEVAR